MIKLLISSVTLTFSFCAAFAAPANEALSTALSDSIEDPVLLSLIGGGLGRRNVDFNAGRVFGESFGEDESTPTFYYRLTNGYNGPSLSLDVVGGTTDLTMATTGDYSGQYWKLVPAPDNPGKFNLRTMYKGDEYSLDVTNDGNKTPHLAETGNYSGQLWTLTNVGNTFKLSNDFTGPSLFLDTYSDSNGLQLATGDTTGMYWTLTLVKIE